MHKSTRQPIETVGTIKCIESEERFLEPWENQPVHQTTGLSPKRSFRDIRHNAVSD